MVKLQLEVAYSQWHNHKQVQEHNLLAQVDYLDQSLLRHQQQDSELLQDHHKDLARLLKMLLQQILLQHLQLIYLEEPQLLAATPCLED